MINNMAVMKTIKQKIKTVYQKIENIAVKPIRRQLLNDHSFSIISNNCWGGFVYQYFGLKYSSPFAGLFLFSKDYLKGTR
jgi:uncharacterized protein (DUF1919 family)